MNQRVHTSGMNLTFRFSLQYCPPVFCVLSSGLLLRCAPVGAVYGQTAVWRHDAEPGGAVVLQPGTTFGGG